MHLRWYLNMNIKIKPKEIQNLIESVLINVDIYLFSIVLFSSHLKDLCQIRAFLYICHIYNPNAKFWSWKLKIWGFEEMTIRRRLTSGSKHETKLLKLLNVSPNFTSSCSQFNKTLKIAWVAHAFSITFYLEKKHCLIDIKLKCQPNF